MSMPATTIADVLRVLTEITERAIHDQNRLGFFSALYLRMTAAVKRAIDERVFDDGERMERFDVIFANRYFEAHELHRNQRQLPRAWAIAFDACRSPKLIALQHIYLGLTAHLLLDLSVSLAESAPGKNIFPLEPDFKRINGVIESLMRDVHRDLGSISPWMGLFDRAAGDLWALGSKSMTHFVRGRAWGTAVELAHLEGEKARAERAIELDRDAAWLAEQIARPPVPIRATIAVVRARESNDVRQVIRAVRGTP